MDIDEIKRRIELGEDIIGRKDQFKKILLDDTYPEYLIKNLENFKNWIV